MNQLTGSLSRREFVMRSAASLPAISTLAAAALESQEDNENGRKKHPNIVLYIADQFRWDCVRAYGLNSMEVTPNLDSLAKRGIGFQNAVTNQPWCSPSRACLFTGQYANQNGVWRLGLGLRPGATTLATTLRSHGYTTHYIGKWHLAPWDDNGSNDQAVRQDGAGGVGYVPPEYRGGFLDGWEASNAIEVTSHPYEGTIWDESGKPMHYEGVHRIDYLTQLAVNYLRRSHEKPFFMVLSQLEPHEQNDLMRSVPPKKYAGKYTNPFVPHDLRFFPGEWQSLLPSYYGDIKAIDDSMGTVLKTLAEQNLTDNTIVVMLSDHGNHFLTRAGNEWKCTPHESSIHIPLLIQGPGFDQGRLVPEVVSMVDVAPSLLDAVGIAAPDSMQGKSFFPVLQSSAAREAWRQEALIQISCTAIGRAIRTKDWTYYALDPRGDGNRVSTSNTYEEYQMYNLATDPHQLLNLAGREETREKASELRERLVERIQDAGEPKPSITPCRFYP
jgi:arylsulfatase A-like enzyme